MSNLTEITKNVTLNLDQIVPKRPKVMSKSGHIYYTNPPERNRKTQRDYYAKHKDDVNARAILKCLEKKGMTPRAISVAKYPTQITIDILLEKFKIFKDTCNDPELIINTSRNFTSLIKELLGQDFNPI